MVIQIFCFESRFIVFFTTFEYFAKQNHRLELHVHVQRDQHRKEGVQGRAAINFHLGERQSEACLPPEVPRPSHQEVYCRRVQVCVDAPQPKGHGRHDSRRKADGRRRCEETRPYPRGAEGGQSLPGES